MLSIPEFKCPYIDKQTIWSVADKFRGSEWGGKELPVDIEKIIEDNLGLFIDPKHDLHSVYDIDAYLRFDLTGIVVDYGQYMNEKYANRLRFSLAHELGHLYLHQDVYEDFGITNLAQWKEFMSRISERQYGFFEFQANEFAGRALVPRDRLILELDNCIKTLKENGLYNIFIKDPGTALGYISNSLCKPFGVSNQVIERRVEREGVWPP